ncbi:MAG: YtxH domain-containing protein [Chloroflexi bacterium]|nr:YtxH domain-containing protein [Chloroflexota bacterium]MCX6915784.1 YtxH domain-containing protein [Verrucomicrobiota bacterium]
MSDNGGGEFFVGFIIGAMAGAAAALLLTPRSGSELRGQIQEKGIELKDQAARLADQAKTQAQQAVEGTRGQVTQVTERGRIVLAENVKKAQQAVEEAQAKIATPAA